MGVDECQPFFSCYILIMSNLPLSLLMSLFYIENNILKWKISTSTKIHIGDEVGSLCSRKNHTSYLRLSYNSYRYYVHRIMYQIYYQLDELPSNFQIDHIDGNGLNNSKDNLRLATPSDNRKNTQKSIRNKSGYKGVSWHNRDKKWRSQIGYNGIHFYIGSYNNPILAAIEYDKKAIELFGEYACINFPQLVP